MRASAILEEILLGIDSSTKLSEAIKRDVKSVVTQVGLLHGIGKMKRMDRLEKVQFASDLLEKHYPRDLIRTRLMSRFSVSRRTAYRIIQGAFQLCQK